jgi:thioredoxin reductase
VRILSTDPDVPGIFAIGQVATGVFACGQMATGLIAIG